MKWQRRLKIVLVLGILFLLSLPLGHLILDARGRDSLKIAGSHLQDLTEHTLKPQKDRASVSASTIPGNAAPIYREVLDPFRGSTSFTSSGDSIDLFFSGDLVETADLERDVKAQEVAIQTLRKAVRCTRCDWDLHVAVRRTCGLGGATVAKVGYSYEPWTFGLYYLAPRLAAAAELSRRQGDTDEALNLLLDSMGVCLDMARGESSFNPRMIPSRLERLSELLTRYSGDLKSGDPGWDRVEAALGRLHQGSQEYLKSWRVDLLLPMYGEVYLPTYARMVFLDRDETSSAAPVLKHFARTLCSPHASAARLYSLYEELWLAMDRIAMKYDPACLDEVEQAVRRVRDQDIFHRDGVDSVMEAVVTAFRLEAALRMTRISWRLARHRSGSGTWPESLETADIPAEWQDPFTGKPFAYRLDEQPKLETEGRASDKTHLPYRPLKWALPE